MSEADQAPARRRGDDFLAVAALLVGTGVAAIFRGEPLELAGGVALAAGGAALALRGERPIEGAAWLRAALALSAVATLFCHGIAFYQEWIVGQWFAEGAQPAETSHELRNLARYASAARIAGLAFALAFLLGAVVARLGPDKRK